MPALKIIVAHSQIPLKETANERLAAGLEDVLRHFGHRVTRLRLPLPPDPEILPRHVTAARLLDLETCDGEPADLLIALDLLSGCLRHRHKILWICDPFGGLSGPASPVVQETLRRAARLFLSESARALAVSGWSAAALGRLTERDARALLPPLPGDLPTFETETEPSDGPRVLVVPAESGRLPVDRLLRVMEDTRDELSFTVYARTGNPEPDALYAGAEERGLDLRRLGTLDHEPAGRFDAVWPAAVDEYSPWPAWRALARRRPTLATFDAGASAEVLGDTGLGPVVDGDPAAVSAALRELVRPNDEEAIGDGTEALRRAYPAWTDVVTDLLAEGRS